VKQYLGNLWKKKNKYDDREIRALTARPNVVRTTVRTLSVGMSLFFLYNAAFSFYNHREQRKFIRQSAEVVHQAQALVDSLREERAYLLPGKSSPLEQVVVELQALRNDLLGCQVPRVLERGRYVADVNACKLHVTIPAGGSLSEASELYFHDPARWRDDWKRNPQIKNPNYVHPGQRYTFSLR
jgi:hypothetical protein